MQMVFNFPISPRYSFSNFVLCEGNELAYRFTTMLAKDPAQRLLYLYGPPGSGKTHLLAALGKALMADQRNNDERGQIPYISFREVDELYQGQYHPEQPSRLAEHFENAPVLLVDDLHLIPDNDHIKLELWQVFNDFMASGRKIAITGLLNPRDLPTLDGHLISRLLWGLVAQMDVSDDDSRRLIIRKLAEDRQMIMPPEVIDFLLSHAQRDIPSLLGVVESLNLYSLATGRKISVRLVRNLMESKAVL